MNLIKDKLNDQRFNSALYRDDKKGLNQFRLWYTNWRGRPWLYAYDDYLKYERAST